MKTPSKEAVMGLREWALANGVIQGLKFVRAKGKVSEIADKIDETIDETLPRRSENVQQAIVVELLLPLCTELMKERPITLQKHLMDIVQGKKRKGR